MKSKREEGKGREKEKHQKEFGKRKNMEEEYLWGIHYAYLSSHAHKREVYPHLGVSLCTSSGTRSHCRNRLTGQTLRMKASTTLSTMH